MDLNPAGIRKVPRAAEWCGWIAAAFAVRLLYGWIVQPYLEGPFGWSGDDGYDEIARLWLDGQGYVRWPGGPPTLERLPLYPLFLAGLFRLGGGAGGMLVAGTQALLSSVTLLPLGVLASRLGGLGSCRMALLLATLHPVGILYNFRYMTEPLHSFLVLVCLWWMLRWIEEGGWLRAALAGVTFGALALTRSALLPLAPWIAVAAVLARHRALAGAGRAGRRSILAQGVLALAACAVVLLPWVARAHHLGGGLISSGSAAAWYHGLDVSRAAWNGGSMGEVDRASDQALDAILRIAIPDLKPADPRWEIERDALTRRLALDRFLAEPWLRLAELGRNLTLSWYLTYTPHASVLAALFQVPLIIAMAVALRRRGRKWPPGLWPALALLAGQVLLQAAAYPHFRFMAPATWVAMALVSDLSARGPERRARTVA